MHKFLKRIPLFADLADEDLDQLCQMIRSVKVPAGTELFTEGSPGDEAYIIQEGQVEIYKKAGGHSILLAVRQAGEVIGEMSLLDSVPRNASGRTRIDSTLLVISHKQLEKLLDSSPSTARTLLYTISTRLKSTELLLEQSRKMAELGALTAGVAHELNNPAAAVGRSAGQLREQIDALQHAQMALGHLQLNHGLQEQLDRFVRKAKENGAKVRDLDPLVQSDLENELELWLEGMGVPDAWDLAPVLVGLGLSVRDVDGIIRSLEDVPGFTLSKDAPAVMRWLGATFSIYSLLEEISQGAQRISETVKALKSYSYLDQAPVQLINIHEGLDNTLIMLRGELKDGITIRREYEDDLPRIEAYGSELNQVWTNLIMNAVEAMEGRGTIILRTYARLPWVCLEVEDNGPGIPKEIQPKIFSPFFTTKAIGKGTGLGLHVSYNIIQKHGGDMKVYSRPGKTRFVINLPTRIKDAREGDVAIEPLGRFDDQKMKEILENTKTIAIVGAGSQLENTGYSVSVYLKEKGYQVFPVSKRHDRQLGERTYPDLTSIQEPVDMVLLFGEKELGRLVIAQAAQVGVRTVWMHEGVIDESLAASARDGGMDVVMDSCIRTTHKRLFSSGQVS